MHYFHENLAVAIGLSEAVFIQNLYYLLKRRLLEIGFDQNKNLWVKLSSTRLSEFQPYFTRSQLRTIVRNLLVLGVVQNEKKHLQYNSNTLSYTLTTKGWAYMIYLDSFENQEKLKEVILKCKHQSWSKQGELWLFLAKTLAISDRPWLNLAKDWSNLANIYIEDRYLIDNIENTKNILKLLDSSTFINKKYEKNIDGDDKVSNSCNDKGSEDIESEGLNKFQILDLENLESIKTKNSFEMAVNKIFEKNLEFKRKVLKSFEGIENFKAKVLYPSVEKTSYSDVLKALKKVAENFFGYMSPVAEFFAVLRGLK